MADSEFNGRDLPQGYVVDPLRSANELEAWEQLRLTYQTGVVDPAATRDGGRAWTGQGVKKQLTPSIPPPLPVAPRSFAESLLAQGPVGPAGPMGPAGPPGVGGPQYLSKIAASAVSGHRVVTSRDDGLLELADYGQILHLGQPVWLTVQAAEAGVSVQVLVEGEIVEPTWSWLLHLPLYLGADGAMTQTIPTSPPGLFMLEVARPINSTTIFFDPQIPIALGA